MTTINVQDLRKEFEISSGVEVAVDGVNLDIDEGEFITLVGPSGCGKTTTLRCIAGLEQPTSGTIRFDGEDVTEVPAEKRGLAMMFQNIALYPHMSIIDNIAYPLKIRGVSKDERYQQARDAAEVMQIDDMLDKKPGDLSGGQRQRAALARTVVQDPFAFLMDEPLSDLDAKLQIELRREILRVHKRLGRPTVYVTHDQEEAMTLSDRIAVMNDGHIEQFGTREQVYYYPNNLFVAHFIGNPSINTLEGELESLDGETGRVRTHGRTLEFSVDRYEAASHADDVLVGFRPQSVTLADLVDDPVFDLTLSFLEPIDDRALARLDGPEGELRALVPSNQPLVEGNEVPVGIDTDELFIFDATTKELVATSGVASTKDVSQSVNVD
ncbi:ATP-binding cassette domain-containing protein [Halorubrum sp. CBA1125]|uniref:ABC transporter ATP-binding protein n=1 Tax=Halorubrum sp. CBA1125 TaxID=2668072 RepID=UPI0012E74E6D|nr:ABC transporter ATP-binding protein [Halorubrum sp. CBA1125]MUW13804.1 ATP-binding cassette domain-containing protein [Halorubrum sp. CBA1125]